MAKIFNTETIKRILDDAGIQTSADDVPTELARKVVPVLISNPTITLKVKTGTASDATSATIRTNSTTKRTFLFAVALSISKDVVNDSINSGINITPLGDSVAGIMKLRYEPTVAGNLHDFIVLPYPIELEKGTAINVTNSTNTASIDASAAVYFYEMEDLKK